jgi:hypothetical protein
LTTLERLEMHAGTGLLQVDVSLLSNLVRLKHLELDLVQQDVLPCLKVLKGLASLCSVVWRDVYQWKLNGDEWVCFLYEVTEFDREWLEMYLNPQLV